MNWIQGISTFWLFLETGGVNEVKGRLCSRQFKQSCSGIRSQAQLGVVPGSERARPVLGNLTSEAGPQTGNMFPHSPARKER